MGYTERMNKYSDKMTPLFVANDTIPNELFSAHGVNRGLRDINGKGVLTGLTSISKINAFKEENGQRIPCDGELWYRGYQVQDLIKMYGTKRFGYERTAFLLLFGRLPDDNEFEEFKEILALNRSLPTNFTRDVIMKAPSHDIMNSMTRSILTLASYDDDVADLSLNNVLKQCIRLIAVFPMLAVYGYHAYNHYECDESMYIHRPDPQLSTAENLLMMLRPDKSFTYLEAEVLDIALILHMEHGGGNNSTFTTRVVTSSGSDTYSAIGAAMSSLKGPRHGGANLKVMEMMHDIKMHVTDINNEDKVRAYLERILSKEAFDHKGLIYGMGHAVYSLSDPRERVFKGFVKELSDAKHKEREMKLYSIIEEEATELIAKERKIYKGVSPNVDFYSGFVYDMLGIPRELFTPIFAVARISGWSAHRLEELVGNGKIIRPAYLSVMKEVN
ncbi:MAG: citrate/2-methylcitrate synthase [Eubacteriales bacterium]|nr:citrate/2-methylcitrate synthase [Eubacteriales bacterium]